MKRKFNKFSKLLLALLLTLASFDLQVFAEESDVNGGEEVVEVVEATETTEQTGDSEVLDTTVTTEVVEEQVDLSVLDDVDFSSGRLLVSEEAVLEEAPVVATLDGTALLQYETEEEAKKAYLELAEQTSVEVDGNNFGVAEETSEEATPIEEVMTESENPFTEVNNADVDAIQYDVAVIDTGAVNADKIVSVLGDDGVDRHGHGQRMIDTIKEINSNAKVLSIKALDDKGVGTISAVYAGIELAIAENVKIINLSISAQKVADSYVIEEIINKAVTQGIKVVGAAGNNNNDASGYVPGSVLSAIVVGASDGEGNKQPNSNYGNSVDYYMPAESTSIASAKASAYLSLGEDLSKVSKSSDSDNEENHQPKTVKGLMYVKNEQGLAELKEVELDGDSYFYTADSSGGGEGAIPGSGLIVGDNQNGTVYVWFDNEAHRKADARRYSLDDYNNSTKLNAEIDYWIPKLTNQIKKLGLSVSPDLQLLERSGFADPSQFDEDMQAYRTAFKNALYNALDRRTDTDKAQDVKARIVAVGVTFQLWGTQNSGVWFLGAPHQSVPEPYTGANVITGSGKVGTDLINGLGINDKMMDWNAVPSDTLDGTVDKWYLYAYKNGIGDFTSTYRRAYDRSVFAIAVLDNEPPSETELDLSLTKTSANQNCTNGNRLYSLEGAEYAVYTDAQATTPLIDSDGTAVTLTTNANGVAEKNDVAVNTVPSDLWVKETKAPKGYELDETPRKATKNGDTFTFTVQDTPKNDPDPITLNKINSEGMTNIPSLEGAEFTIKYYDVEEGEALSKATTVKTWVIKTKEINGRYSAELKDDYLVNGSDPLYKNSFGFPIVPLGTITIQETKAPIGYTLEGGYLKVDGKKVSDTNGIITLYIKDNNGDVQIEGGNIYTKEEEPIKVGFIKQDDKGKHLSGVVLQVKDGNTVVEEWTTNGSIHYVKYLTAGKTYTLHEVSAPEEWELADDITFKPSADEVVAVTMKDAHKTSLKLTKKDADLNNTKQGDASIEGAVFTLYDTSDNNKEVGKLTVKANGTTNVIANLSSKHNYKLVETTVPAGYKKTGDITITGSQLVSGRDDNYVFTANATNTIVRGDVKIEKWDKELNKKVAQGNADFSGIKFEITNKSKSPVFVGGKEYAVNAVVATITTNASGDAQTTGKLLPYGTYSIKEVATNNSYLLTDGTAQTFTIREDGQVVTGNTSGNAIVFKNNVVRGGAGITKKDADITKDQGDGSLQGIEYAIVNRSNKSVVVEGKEYNKDVVVKIVKLDANGTFKTANNLLPFGKYDVIELSKDHTVKVGSAYNANQNGKSVWANDNGYLYKAQTKSITVDTDKKIYETEFTDTIAKGSFKMQKNDMDLDTNYAQGDTGSLKATYTVKNKSKNPVFVNGKEYKVGEVVYTFDTKDDGTFTAPAKLLPYGTYELEETVAPVHHTKRGNTKVTFTIREDGEVKDLTKEIENDPARLTLKVQKRDNLTGSNKPMGSGTLEGAVFEVYNNSAKDITYKGNRIKVGELVDTVTTDKNGVATLENLPYGTYLVKEIKAPKGYVLKGHLESTVVLHGEDGSEVFAQEYRGKNGTNSTNKSIDNDPIRGDFELRKISSEPQGRMSNIQFKVTSRTTGESAIFMTDENGEFRSISTWNSHKENTNKGETELDGIWFGQYVDDNGDTQTLEPDDELGAMPYDTYDIEELPGPNNEGYTMWKDSFTVSRDKVVVQLNNIENTKLEIGTKATSLNNDKIVPAVEDTIIIDTVEVKGAKNLIGEKAMLVGTLMDKETCEALTVDGATAQIIFDVKKADFEKEIEFTVDGTKLQGKNIVVFEKLYKVTVDENGNVLTEEEVGKHEDIDDEDQLVTIPEARTTLKDQKTDTHVVEYREDVTLVDTVVYKGLKKGRTYEVKGILMDKETGKPFLDADGKEVTATKQYKATASDGEVELTFTFKGIKKGMKIVAFETVYYKGEEYIVHADLNDEDQTVYVPEIKTRAEGVNETQFIVEGEDATIVDTIDYKAFVPGETYVLKGTIYDKTEGKLTDITAESEPFVAETSEGSVEVVFNFDATGLGGHTLVVYEKAFMGEKPSDSDKPIATHEDPDDEDQTIFVEEPEDEKYVNKVVHEDLGSFKDTFTYDIMGYVTHDADAIEFTDELVEALEFVSTAEDVKVYVHDTNDHKPNGTVASEGTLLEAKEVEIKTEGEEPTKATTPVVKIEGQKLTVEILNGEEYRGKWLRVEFDAKIKDAYKSLESLKQLTVEDNGNVLTEEVHTGVPNEAEMIIKVNNVGKHKIKTNPVTVIPPTPEIKTTLVAENLKTVYRGQVYEMTDTVEYKNLEIGEKYRMEGYLVNDKGEELPVEPSSVEFVAESRDGEVEMVFTVDTSLFDDEHVVAFETLYVLGDVDKDTEPTDDNPTPTKDTPVAEHKDPKDPSQTVTVIEPDVPSIEKYINKAVHKDVTLDEVFTYDIIAFVPQNADEIELTDTLNSDLQFVSKASDITLVDLGMDNNHMVENNIYNEKVNDNATVALEGTKADAEVKIDGQKLSIKANAENLRGHYVKATFNAKIKDGMKVEDLKYSEIVKNEPVITDEEHFGIPNEAELKVRVRNDWSKDYKSNTVTIKTVKIGTIAKFDNGEKSVEAGDSNKVIDTIKFTGLNPNKKYVAYAQMMDKDGNAVSKKARFEFTVKNSNGEVEVPIEFETENLEGKYVAFEEVYELVVKAGKETENFVAEHKDLEDEDQTVTVTKTPVEIRTIAKFDNGKKSIEAGKSNKVIDTIIYKGLNPNKRYVAYAQMMDKSGKEVSMRTRFEFTVETKDGEIEVVIPFVTEKLDGQYVAFEELYEIVEKDGKTVEIHVAEHKDLTDKDQTVTVAKPRVPDTGTSLPYIAIGVGLAAIIGLVLFFFKKKKA